MKKFVSVFLACFMMCSFLVVQSFAVDLPEEQKTEAQQVALKEAEQYAYLDIDTASPELKEKILDARNEIIFSQDWVADGFTGRIGNVKTGEIIKELPQFSELFPDWDIPVLDTVPESEYSIIDPPSNKTVETEVRPLADTDSWLRIRSERTYIESATSVNADPFLTFEVNPYTMGTSVRAYPIELTSSRTCNIGFSYASNGVSYGSGTNLSLYDYVQLDNLYYTNISVRASTYSTPGWGTIALDGAYRVQDLR